jgi:AcrR family transcriptional regulator
MPTSSKPPARRRRGDRLEAEIREAVFAELAEHGYRGLTMEGVARRAGTGKAPLYRRWPGKEQLILAALSQRPPGATDPAVDTGALRSDLIALLTQLSNAMAQPVGRALYTLITELIVERQQHPDLAAAVIDNLLEPRLDAIMAALRRAARRGEIRPGVVSELLARTGPALIIHQQLSDGSRPTKREIEDIVDTVLLPALVRR